MTVARLLAAWPWKPIRHCPGRFILAAGDPRLTLERLLDEPVRIRAYRSAAAKDPVLVVPLEDGGLISYAHADGSFVHTLNTPEGFVRKLAQLGIVPEPPLPSETGASEGVKPEDSESGRDPER